MCNNLSHTSQHPPLLPAAEVLSASGYCRGCGSIHGLPMAQAYLHCRELIHHFSTNRTIDLQAEPNADPRLTTEYLFGPARGKMFGVLECRCPDGSTAIVRAFSGQYNGLWQVPGWAPPLFDVEQFSATNDSTERRIKELGQRLDQEAAQTDHWRKLRRERRDLSRKLMLEIHAIYRLTNFRGRTETLFAAYSEEGGIPTGTGDCCAPKLLNHAAVNNLVPVGLAEFYWGLDNKSGSRRHGRFYPSCREKCQPILGYLLCGLGENHAG